METTVDECESKGLDVAIVVGAEEMVVVLDCIEVLPVGGYVILTELTAEDKGVDIRSGQREEAINDAGNAVVAPLGVSELKMAV